MPAVILKTVLVAVHVEVIVLVGHIFVDVPDAEALNVGRDEESDEVGDEVSDRDG